MIFSKTNTHCCRKINVSSGCRAVPRPWCYCTSHLWLECWILQAFLPDLAGDIETWTLQSGLCLYLDFLSGCWGSVLLLVLIVDSLSSTVINTEFFYQQVLFIEFCSPGGAGRKSCWPARDRRTCCAQHQQLGRGMPALVYGQRGHILTCQVRVDCQLQGEDKMPWVTYFVSCIPSCLHMSASLFHSFPLYMCAFVVIGKRKRHSRDILDH